MKIKTQNHTIFLMVGPSNCGKSYFVDEMNERLNRIEITGLNSPNVQIISSDKIRRDLLGSPCLHKHDKEMLHASDGAFDMLFKKLETVTSYPINANFVFVDTTGLSKMFRDRVLEIAKKNHYNIDCVIFDFKERIDYYRYMNEYDDRYVVSKHIKRLRTETFREIKSKDFTNIHKIKTNEYDDIEIELENYHQHNKLSPDVEYLIVGDVHECIDEFKTLLEETGFDDGNNTDKKVILIGDYIDKGDKLEETINYIYSKPCHILIVLGNHEHYVYRRLNDEIKPNEELELKYFGSIKKLESDENLKRKFQELVERSMPFFTHRDFIVTHAPCEKKYLGKMDSFSLKHMRNMSVGDLVLFYHSDMG